jgi:hypothetical protein
VDEDLEIDALAAQDDQPVECQDSCTQQKTLGDMAKLNEVARQQNAVKTKPMVLSCDRNGSDEEDVVHFQSEFCSVGNDNTNDHSAISAVLADEPRQETGGTFVATPISSEVKQTKQRPAAESLDVDDLAVAVKKKKSKKSKKRNN